ncbi:MAG TPA: glycoside hydrolase [Acidobacteriaceae bacterium]
MKLTRRNFIRTASTTAALACAPCMAWPADSKGAASLFIGSFAQQMDGFGFSEAFHQARRLQNLPTEKRAAILDLLFSPVGGMGFSILRNSIGNTDGTPQADQGDTVSIEPAQGVWNWTGDEDQIWLMNEAKKRGCSRFISCAWSAPAWMKTNKSTIGNGGVRPDMYQAFADYLATYVEEYKKRYNLDIYGISPANEPDYTPTIKYASSRWTGEQLTRFLRENLIPTFAKKSLSCEIMLDDHANWHDDFINVVLADPVCAKALHIVCAHAYAATSSPFMPLGDRTGTFNTALKAGKRIWQTEVSAGDKNLTSMDDGIYWASVLHAHVNWNSVSAWLYWWGTDAQGPKPTRGSLLLIDPTTGAYQLSKRLFTIGQYSRFVRPGARRINATENPIGNVRFDAFLDPSGKKLICVAINDDNKPQEFPIQFGSFPATTCIPVRTSVTESHQKLPALKPANGQVVVQTPAESVTTFIIG